MKIINSVVVVGLYYGFLTTFSIGPSYLFLLRALVMEEPRGRMMMEMYCGLLLFINSNLILLQLMLRISRTLQASSFAQHFLPTVSLFS